MLFGFNRKPFYAPDVDAGAEAPVETSRVPLNEAPVDGPGSGRSDIRRQLEEGFKGARKAQEDADKERDKQTGRFKSRARQELEAQEQEPAPEGEPQEEAVAQEAEAVETPEGEQESKAPDGWAKDAKALWTQLPPEVQAAVTKREADMAKGVDDLKKRYSEIDQALQPRLDTIRRHGHTPAQAINQLFAWFEALSANPVQAFPALANSFRFDLRSIPGLTPQQQEAAQQAQKEAPKEADEIPPYVKTLEQQLQELKAGFSQQLGQLSTTFAQQSQARTEENLMQWAKDKPYFEEVRKTMAHLIASNIVPPLPNGNADLDKAYDMAVYALPEVRAKVQAEANAKAAEAAKAKAEAERKAQQALADKARKAAGSLQPSAPGMEGTAAPKKGKSKSVRDSIMEAREELSNR